MVDRKACPQHAARLQRERRQRLNRIDYVPEATVLSVIREQQRRERPGSVAATNRAVIDAIVIEWARMTGRLPCEKKLSQPERRDMPNVTRSRAGAFDCGIPTPELSQHYTRAYDFGTSLTLHAKPLACGAKRHRDGQPCEAKPEPGKRRCRFHGGRSTGPRTADGKARALANLVRGQSRREPCDMP